MSKTYEIACQREINPLYLDLLNAVKQGHSVNVEVKRKASKTMEQLGYYWAEVLPRIQTGLEEQGCEMSLPEINQFLNEKFFCITRTVIWKKGNDEHVHVIRTPKSKSGASKDEMSAFLDRVMRWANVDLAVFIQEPSRVGNFSYEN